MTSRAAGSTTSRALRPPSSGAHSRRPGRGAAADHDEVGDLANLNLTDLGHIVVYVNSPEQALLPGAVKASGPSRPQPTVGSPIVIAGD